MNLYRTPNGALIIGRPGHRLVRIVWHLNRKFIGQIRFMRRWRISDCQLIGKNIKMRRPK